MAFHEISYKDIQTNPFTDFGENWMALSVGKDCTRTNAMTIA